MPQQALHLLLEMQLRGLMPAVITYSAASSALNVIAYNAAISAEGGVVGSGASELDPQTGPKSTPNRPPN